MCNVSGSPLKVKYHGSYDRCLVLFGDIKFL